ncbi:MAG TPA: hypothetical protein VHV50_09535 [Actinomycetota bacterium]|jgi:hypothetical protein|nr:hypothetical protein [Actinomycetota bacterium]
MSLKRCLSVAGVLALGIVAIYAIGASSARAPAKSHRGTPIAFKALVNNGFHKTIVGVPGAAVRLRCTSQTTRLILLGTAANGMAKVSYANEGGGGPTGTLNPHEVSASADDLDNGEFLFMNRNGTSDEVSGTVEFVNGARSRTMTVQYGTEDNPPNSPADCAIWGSAIKGAF